MLHLGSTEEDIARAAEILRAGGIVAFPTETVYGLGARADEPDAVRRIFEAKGRPASHPVIVHLPSADWLDAWASEVPPEARELATRFWPGPLTLILKRGDSVSDVVTGGQDTVGLRVPGHPVALGLLQSTGVPLAAPSANRFGRVSATTAAHVIQDFGDSLDAVIDGGPCPVGLESTIVDLSGSTPRILRPGAIAAASLQPALDGLLGARGEATPRVPGALRSHYSPITPLELVEPGHLAARVGAEGGSVCVVSRRPRDDDDATVHWIEMPQGPVDYARALYDALRRADRAGTTRILVERPPTSEDWTAIVDRLTRAATSGPS